MFGTKVTVVLEEYSERMCDGCGFYICSPCYIKKSKELEEDELFKPVFDKEILEFRQFCKSCTPDFIKT